MGKSKDELEVQNDGSSTPTESGSGGNVFLESCEHVASLNSKSQQDLSEKTFEKASERPVPQFLQGWRLYVVSIGLMLALFLSGLDRSIVAVATPAISAEFNSLKDVGWYGSAYLLTMCCFQLPVGKLSAELNVKWVFLGTLAIFEVGSIICAAAPSSIVLIVGRAIAGVGGAGIIGGALIVVGTAVEPTKRPIYMAVSGAMANVAQAFGPLIGGVLVKGASWRWCFWINLPIGGVTAGIILFTLRVPSAPLKHRGGSWVSSTLSLLDDLDALGTATLVPSIICLLLALQWGGTEYAWSNWRPPLLLALFGISLIAWMYMQYKRGDRATVPPRIIKQRTIAFGNIYTIASWGSSITMLYYLPIWFQSVRGASALRAGINVSPLMLSWAALLIVSAQMTVRTGYFAPQMLVATIVMSVLLGLITLYNANTSKAFWATTLFFYGAGIGFGAQQPFVAAQLILKGKDISLATSLIMFLQILSGTIMVSVGQNVFVQRLGPSLAAHAPGVDPLIVISAGNENLAEKMARYYSPDTVERILVAYNNALHHVFVFALALTCITAIGSIGVEWRNLKKLHEKPATSTEEELGEPSEEKIGPGKVAKRIHSSEKGSGVARSGISSDPQSISQNSLPTSTETK